MFGQSAPATESRSGLARVEPVGAGVEDHLDVVLLAGDERRRRRGCVHAVAEGEVEAAARDQRRGAVGEDVAQLDRQRGRRRVGADPQPHPGLADHGLGVAVPLPDQRPGVVLALVGGQPPRQVAGAVDPGGGADVGLDDQRRAARPAARVCVDTDGDGQVSRIQCPSCWSRNASGRVEVRTNTSAHVAGAASRPARAASGPTTRPSRGRGRCAGPGTPWPGRRAPTARRAAGAGLPPRQRLDRAEGVVAVAVGPARDDHHRAVDAVVAVAVAVGADRAVPPVGAVAVLAQPGQHPGLVGLEAPRATPRATSSPHTAGTGRQHAHRRHVVAVVDEVDQPQRAAAPVHVVGPPVVAGVDRADRLERRRPLAARSAAS